MSKALVLGAAALTLSAGAASAQVPGYDYSGAVVPLYGYAAPPYGYGAMAPAIGGSTIIIVTPGQGYSPPVVGSGYYNYAPGYWGGGYGRAGYWGGYGWR